MTHGRRIARTRSNNTFKNSYKWQMSRNNIYAVLTIRGLLVDSGPAADRKRLNTFRPKYRSASRCLR